MMQFHPGLIEPSLAEACTARQLETPAPGYKRRARLVRIKGWVVLGWSSHVSYAALPVVGRLCMTDDCLSLWRSVIPAVPLIVVSDFVLSLLERARPARPCYFALSDMDHVSPNHANALLVRNIRLSLVSPSAQASAAAGRATMVAGPEEQSGY